MNVSVWDEAGGLLQTGDICKLTKGLVVALNLYIFIFCHNFNFIKLLLFDFHFLSPSLGQRNFGLVKDNGTNVYLSAFYAEHPSS